MRFGERQDSILMTSANFRQLNPFEVKIAINELLSKINSVNDIQNCLADFDMLEAQENKEVISKILFILP